MKNYSEVYAVDFDGTLNLADKYPSLGEPNRELFDFLKQRQQFGDKIILYTCREGKLLEAAVRYCRIYGLEFDTVNDNLKENIERWGNNCRKIFADHYIDDKNMEFRPGYSPEVKELVDRKQKEKWKMEIKETNCKVCNHPLNIKKENVYVVKNIRNLAYGDQDWDATDCPYCGCQNLLKQRFKKMRADEKNESNM